MTSRAQSVARKPQTAKSPQTKCRSIVQPWSLQVAATEEIRSKEPQPHHATAGIGFLPLEGTAPPLGAGEFGSGILSV